MCNVLNASLAVYLWQKGGGQSVAVTALFIVMNAVLPGLLSVIMIYLQRKRVMHAATNEDAKMI